MTRKSLWASCGSKQRLSAFLFRLDTRHHDRHDGHSPPATKQEQWVESTQGFRLLHQISISHGNTASVPPVAATPMLQLSLFCLSYPGKASVPSRLFLVCCVPIASCVTSDVPSDSLRRSMIWEGEMPIWDLEAIPFPVLSLFVRCSILASGKLLMPCPITGMPHLRFLSVLRFCALRSIDIKYSMQCAGHQVLSQSP